MHRRLLSAEQLGGLVHLAGKQDHRDRHRHTSTDCAATTHPKLYNAARRDLGYQRPVAWLPRVGIQKQLLLCKYWVWRVAQDFPVSPATAAPGSDRVVSAHRVGDHLRFSRTGSDDVLQRVVPNVWAGTDAMSKAKALQESTEYNRNDSSVRSSLLPIHQRTGYQRACTHTVASASTIPPSAVP
jgi:hypothetical protein